MAMDPPSSSRFPPTPGLPLFPLSPERINGTRPPYSGPESHSPSKQSRAHSRSPEKYMHLHVPQSPNSSPTRNLFADFCITPTKTSGFVLSQSPSLPELDSLRRRQGHAHTNSDVQGMVARFDHLDIKDRDEEKRRDEAALRRAVIGREEAESDARRLREEVREMKRDMEEGQEREAKVARRLEGVMEEFGRARESHTHTTATYEKDLRRAKKETFKSSSALLKCQEELKATRNSLRITQSGLDMAKQKAAFHEERTFSAQRQLAGLQDELDRFREMLRVVEEERDSLRSALKVGEVARIAAEGTLAPSAKKDEDRDRKVWSSPRKTPATRAQSPLSDDKENAAASLGEAVVHALEEELKWEKERREQAEEMVEFMQMECQFMNCSCRVAERRGQQFRHDIALGDELRAVKMEAMRYLTQPESEHFAKEIDADMNEEGALSTQPKQESATGEAEMWKIEPATDASPMKVDHQEETGNRQQQQILNTGKDASYHATTRHPSSAYPRAQQMAGHDTNTEAAHADQTNGHKAATSPPSTTTIPVQASGPQTPTKPNHQSTPFRHHGTIRTITTTTTIPMHFTPVAQPHPLSPLDNDTNTTPTTPTTTTTTNPNPSTNPTNQTPLPPHTITTTHTPSTTIDRAAALAAIQYRRGRARSLANGHLTPRKQMLDGVGVLARRDISAPALGGKIGGGDVVGGGSVGRATGRAGRGVGG
ncbi:hypothetical protein LTR66_007833 [Elasticomyces elasticus]|nr:hypothetical protein LTR66_007833 [Elasticomyces elasticus]